MVGTLEEAREKEKASHATVSSAASAHRTQPAAAQ
jgi:hypothetical protein